MGKKGGDGSEESEDIRESTEGKETLMFEDSDNERFKFHSRTKTPFFLVSEPDERKEGLELIKEISEELDEITKTIPYVRCYQKPEAPPQHLPMNLKNLPKATKRDLNKEASKQMSYKTPLPSTTSINKTFSFFQ